jgi:hypothetical protein
VRVRLTDSFNLGTAARLCVVAPAARKSCRTVQLPDQGRPARSAFRVTERGRWRVTVSTAHQRTSHTVAVGVPARYRPLPHIFFTGDSMMQSLDNVIADRLAGRAQTTSNVFAGTSLTKPVINLITNARARVRELRADATVVFVGPNDRWPIRTVECCDEPWIALYTRRVRRLIRAGGRRTVVITLPAPRDADLRAAYLAVNEALHRATAAEPRSRLVDLVPLLTPGFVYRDSILQHGRPLYVRESDGIHISIDGAPFVASLVIRALEYSGAVQRR